MTSAPQIRLRTIFVLFFCAAVGLTASKGPLDAIRRTVEITIAIGLLQQAWQMLHWRTLECRSAELSFARRFAIIWRIVVAATLVVCVIWQLLLTKQFVAPPDQNTLLTFYSLDVWQISVLPQLCVLIALCNSLTRWRPPRSKVSVTAIRTALWWVLGIALVLFVVVDGTAVEFLVHRAVHGIERAQKFPRFGLYIRLSDEGYDAIWWGLAAVVGLIGAIALAIHPKDEQSWSRAKPFRWFLFLLLLVPSAAFCVWYHRYEFPRLSPDMAGAGLAISFLDALSGVFLAVVALTVGAYRLAVMPAPVATICADLSLDLDRRAIHESLLVLFVMFLSACGAVLSLASTFLVNEPALGGIPIGRLLSYFLYPMSLMAIATLVVTVQLCLARWKTRSHEVPWLLHALSLRRFGESWMMLALLAIVGAPALRAFGFLLWLGPRVVASFFGF
jgi:hypothetical protein